MTKKNFLTTAGWLATVLAVAQTGTSVYLNRTDGGTTEIPMATLRTMTFDGGALVCHLADGTAESHAVAGLRTVTFAPASTTGIAAVTDGSARRLPVVAIGTDGMARIHNAGDEPTDIILTAADGTTLRRVWQSPAEGIRVGDLPRGIYLLSIDGQTLKFVKP